MEWCKAHCHWTLEQWKHVLWSDESCFWWASLHLADARRTLLAWLHNAWGIMVWGCFSGVGLGPFLPVKGNYHVSEYENILDNAILVRLWQHFGEGSFLFQHDYVPVHKSSSIKTWLDEFGVEEPDWPTQSPDLNPIQHLWYKLEWRLWARLSHSASALDITNALLDKWAKIPTETLQNLVESPPRRVEAVITAMEWPTPC